MRLLELTSELKGKIIEEIFFNENDWVIKFTDKTAITLGLEEFKRKAVCYMDKNNIVIKNEVEMEMQHK